MKSSSCHPYGSVPVENCIMDEVDDKIELVRARNREAHVVYPENTIYALIQLLGLDVIAQIKWHSDCWAF